MEAEFQTEKQNFQWYALRVQPGYERKIKGAIEKRLVLRNAQEQVIDIFIPSEKVKKKLKGKEVTKESNYFPGYMFINMSMSSDLWHLLVGTPKVSGFVTDASNQPLPVSEKELEKVHQTISTGAKQAEIDSHFQVEQEVKITEGPFTDFIGRIESVDAENSKLVVLVNIFGRSTPLELNFEQVITKE